MLAKHVDLYLGLHSVDELKFGFFVSEAWNSRRQILEILHVVLGVAFLTELTQGDSVVKEVIPVGVSTF